MVTLRNKRKLVAVTTKTQKEHPRNCQSRNTSVSRSNEEHITQVSKAIEGRVTKKLSQEFRRTESCILGALSKLDEFLLNPQIRTHSVTVPGTFRNTNVENQEPNEDRSQDDPHPEVGPSFYQSRHSNDRDPDEAPHNILKGKTWLFESLSQCHHVMALQNWQFLIAPRLFSQLKTNSKSAKK